MEDERSPVTGSLEQREASVTYYLQGLNRSVAERLDTWQREEVAARLWRRDPTLWADEDTPEITNRLGWLDLADSMQADAQEIETFASEVPDEIDDVVVLGMGGSSLAAEVFGTVFEARDGYPDVQVLDSTHPEAVQKLDADLNLTATLFIVASKSGTTTETLSFFRYFWDRLNQTSADPGRRFLATTDPGSNLEKLAEERGFRAVFRAPADVGGRYSALTPFGLVPAALMGLDLSTLLDRAAAVADASASSRDPLENAGLKLGAALGELVEGGRNKVTFVTSPSLDAFPAWQEQLIAESTGKDNTGLVPVDGEPIAGPEAYGNDRAFVYFERVDDEADETTEAVYALADAGYPVLHFRLDDGYDVAREMYRWEVGVATASIVLGVHPFNQPNVEAAKRLAREAMNRDDGLGSGEVNTIPADDASVLTEAIKDWLRAGDETSYIAIQAYLPPIARVKRSLRSLQKTLRIKTGLATTLGYGPRFLHSTGQLHKGGPANGLFLQLVDSPNEEVPVPETDYTFTELIAAQAAGDYRALREANRTVLRVRVDPSNLDRLHHAIDASQ